MFKGKRIFISGGNGVIGNELVKLLYQEGANIFVGDLKPRPISWPADIHYRQGDLNYITEEELNDFDPEIFFHLAATFERSTETYEFWDENYNHNVNLSHHLMTLLKDNKTLKKVIFASSYLIYNKELYNFEKPVEKPTPLKEKDPINPRNLTGCAKLSHEIELAFIKQHRDIQVINARIYRSYGLNSRDVISRWVRSLLKGETLTVFNKENIFDYIFAGDVAEGLLRLAKTDYNGIVNLGTGNSRQISEVISVLKKHFPKMRTKEVGQAILYEASQADTDLLKKLTGWTPPNCLENTIPKIIKYEKEVGFEEDKIDFSVLITSVAKKIGLIEAVRVAMAKIGNSGQLHGGDINAESLGRYFVDCFWLMPKTNDDNLKSIIKYCKKNNIKLVIPSRDGELEFWARNKKVFTDEGIMVMVSDLKTIEACVDKLQFFETCRKLKLPAIQTFLSPDSLQSEKLVVKERFGAGSRSIGLNLDKTEAINHSKSLENPIYQPYVEGQEYSVDLYVSLKKDVKGVIVRERNVVVDGESQITTTVYHKEIEKTARKFAEKLNLFGHNILQVLVDTNNKVQIIECNSRFGGASTLAISAGLDTFYWLMLECLNSDIKNYPFIRSDKNIRQIRYASNKLIKI